MLFLGRLLSSSSLLLAVMDKGLQVRPNGKCRKEYCKRKPRENNISSLCASVLLWFKSSLYPARLFIIQCALVDSIMERWHIRTTSSKSSVAVMASRSSCLM